VSFIISNGELGYLKHWKDGERSMVRLDLIVKKLQESSIILMSKAELFLKNLM